MDPTTADFNAWLAEEGAKIGATVAPQGPPDNFLRSIPPTATKQDSSSQTSPKK